MLCAVYCDVFCCVSVCCVLCTVMCSVFQCCVLCTVMCSVVFQCVKLVCTVMYSVVFQCCVLCTVMCSVVFQCVTLESSPVSERPSAFPRRRSVTERTTALTGVTRGPAVRRLFVWVGFSRKPCKHGRNL